MDALWPKTIAIIEQADGSYTELIDAGLSKRSSSSITIRRFEDCSAPAIFDDELDVDIAFCVLGDEELWLANGESLKSYGPSLTIETLWTLVQVNKFPVHLIVPSTRLTSPDSQFTALDTLAMVLSGVSGVWEGRTQIIKDLGKRELVEFLYSSWDFKRTFLYGAVATLLYDFQMRITVGTWPTTIEGEDGESYLSESWVRSCFEAALALASLTVEEMTLEMRPTCDMQHYAQRLLEFYHRTGFSQALSTVTQMLRYLSRGWSHSVLNYDKRRRNEMPLLARQEGFPSQLPLVRDCDPYQVSRMLFDGLSELDFPRDWEPDQSKYTAVAVNHS
jgi:hypothetical protein